MKHNTDNLEGYTKKFILNWNLEDLQKITDFVQRHFKEKQTLQRNFEILYKFLLKIKKKKEIEEKPYSDKLHQFAFELIHFINTAAKPPKQAHLCVTTLLEICQSSKKTLELNKLLDYHNWQVQVKVIAGKDWYTENFLILRSIAKTIQKTKTEIINLPEFLLYFIANLCYFLKPVEGFTAFTNSKQFLIVMDKKPTKVLKSEYLETILDKLPKNLNDKDLNLLRDILIPKKLIKFSKLDLLVTTPIPLQHPGWHIIQQLLENKLIPLFLTLKQPVVDSMSENLSLTLPLVIIQLIYQYYNSIPSINLEIVAQNTGNQTFRLFYQKPTETGNHQSLNVSSFST